MLYLDTTTAVKLECDAASVADDKDGDKSAAFTVLLHGSLKVEQMTAIVEIGSEIILCRRNTFTLGKWCILLYTVVTLVCL